MQAKIESALSEFEQFLQDKPTVDKSIIIEYLRESPLPFLPCFYEQLSSQEIFNYSFSFLRILGKFNLPLAVAFCMNQYSSFTISLMRSANANQLKRALLSQVEQQKLIIAVSSTDDFIRHKDDDSASIVRCETQPDGSLLCNGMKNFQSNISSADLLIFTGLVDDEDFRLMYLPLAVTQGLEIGPPVYTGLMADADTRALKFKDVHISPEQVLPATSNEESAGMHLVSRAVFSVMVMAPYMGGAERALEEAGEFLHGVHIDKKPLSSLDGYVTDMGRARIKYQLCEDLVERFSSSIALLNDDNMPAWLDKEVPSANALKYHVTASCEELLNMARKVIGTRAMLPGHIIERLTGQIVFGALHPVVNAKIEREFGLQWLESGREALS